MACFVDVFLWVFFFVKVVFVFLEACVLTATTAGAVCAGWDAAAVVVAFSSGCCSCVLSN